MSKCLYVDLNCLNNFSLASVGFLTFTNIKNYIEKNRYDWICTIDDFGNLYIEENVDIWKRCAEYKKVAIILKGGRYEKA